MGLSKQVVDYRIKRMEEDGIINNFWTVIDTFKLGYIVFRIYIGFQDTTPEKKVEVINYFKSYKNTWIAYSVKGNIDPGVAIWVKNIYEFHKFWEKTKIKYGNYMSENLISIYIQADEYENSYLISEDLPKKNRKKFSILCTGDLVKIDSTDYKLLNEIVTNARVPLVDLAKKVWCSSQNINYRLNKLIHTEIIKGFRVGININKLGLHSYSIKLAIKDYSKRNEIIDAIKINPYFNCLNTAIGFRDVEMEFILENMYRLTDIIDDLESKFPNIIRNYIFWSNQVTYKERWLQEMEFK